MLLGVGDARRIPLGEESVQCVVTSPPYWRLRDYGLNGRGIGCEASPDEYVAQLVAVFREVRRVLRKDGTVWLNLGDSYASGGKSGEGEGRRDMSGGMSGHFMGTYDRHRLKAQRRAPVPFGLKPKDLVGIPWRVALALQADGWWLRCDVVWHKPGVMPQSMTDRPTRAHEYVFLLAKSRRYYYDAEAVREESTAQAGRGDGVGRNKRTVWTIATQPYKGAHCATFPVGLVEPMVLAGSAAGDLVLDPFGGTMTVGEVCAKHGRWFVGLDLKREYVEMGRERCATVQTAYAL